MSRPAGIPLLSGPPPHPTPDQKACRKCGREFSILFHRQRRCMHCGFGYCSPCTDYQALMPRSGPAHGYDLAPVCAFCIELLNITALGRAQLRSLPIAKLRRYVAAYNIPVKNPIDKNDFVDAAVAARISQGCLSPVNEDHYRKHSVPSFSSPRTSSPGASSPSSTNRSSSARGSSGASSNTNTGPRSNRPFPRPDLDPNRQQPPPDTPYSTYTPRSRTTSAPTAQGTARPAGPQPNISRPMSSVGQSSAPSTSTTHPPPHSQTAPPRPPPPMSTLVTLPRSSLSTLSAGALKQILFEARVRIPPGVVEKEDLVERVWALVEEERRKDNEGIDDVDFEMHEDELEGFEGPDQEEEVVVEMVDPASEAHMDVAHEHAQGNDDHTTASGAEYIRDSATRDEGHQATRFDLPSSRSPASTRSVSPMRPSSSPSHPAPNSRPRSHAKSTSAERSGLCVICQDEEANIAVVDCGHLAMCRECSELVLASSRECPLCRTRIVTEARLLRIFKT